MLIQDAASSWLANCCAAVCWRPSRISPRFSLDRPTHAALLKK